MPSEFDSSSVPDEEIRELRRQLQRNELLLRELNHRLKNTLAGIIGLMSINPPPVSDETRRWLDRLIERTSAVARAHDLFSNPAELIPLKELIRQLVISLPMADANAVRFEIDPDNATVDLASEQALPLAMALHEICSNAIVHGSAIHGRVCLLVRLTAGRLAVEVIDQGAEKAAGCPASLRPRTKLGLQLVEGLVAGQLGGVFEMRKRPSGGMIAHLEFPVRLKEGSLTLGSGLEGIAE